MTRFLYGDLLWGAITRRVKKAHRTRAAIAYVTTSAPLPLKSADILIVDASNGAIASGQTSAKTLTSFRNKGVELYSHVGLHAKVVVADSVLFASSANVSDSSLSRLLEAGIETDHPNAVSGAVGLIERLVNESVSINESFISRIKKIKVVKHFGGGKSKLRRSAKSHRTSVTWLLGIHNIDDPKDPEELHRIETGVKNAEQFMSNPKSSVAWIRYGPKVRIREARQGDSVVIIARSTSKSNPQRAYRHTSVLRVQPEPNCTRIFYEHLPTAEKKSLSWSQFKKLAKLVGITDGISKDTVRQLPDAISGSLNDRWDEVRHK